ncbi:hypothetical protein P4O66_015496, partial [Electrophorus voltai]
WVTFPSEDNDHLSFKRSGVCSLLSYGGTGSCFALDCDKQGTAKVGTSSKGLHLGAPIAESSKKHHWFPDRPCKGSGYRCIRINHKMDPLVGQAGQRIGLSIQQLYLLLPSELTLWVDPFEVSYRIGEDGSICVLYESQPAATSAPAGTGSSVSSAPPLVDSHISCKEELLVLSRTSPAKPYMMTVSS